MYQFWYCHLKRRYATQCQLLCTDTDSFLFYVETHDIDEDMWRDRHLFDYSDYPTSSELHSLDNKKVPGKCKDEFNGKVIWKFCGPRWKMYATLHQDDSAVSKKRKRKA